MLKTLITYGLSILVFTGGFHVHGHSNAHAADYEICKLGSEDENLYKSHHQCEKCLASSISQANLNHRELTSDQYVISYFGSGKSVKTSFINYCLYGRPPPNLV